MKRIIRASVLLAAVFLAVPGCSKGGNMDSVRAPEIAVKSDKFWINSEPLSMKELKGKVVLIDIWDYTCVNCIRTLPYIKEWHSKYAEAGLVIIGVHSPEFEFAHNRSNVEKAVRDFEITYPVVMDNDFLIWKSYANSYWPRKYLIDKDGYIRYDHIGEGGYEETERKIHELLVETNPDQKLPKIAPDTEAGAASSKGKVCYPMTPELYLGYHRGKIGNHEGFKQNKVLDYEEPKDLVDGFIYAKGTWRNLPEAMVHARNTTDLEDYIAIRYHAIEVNAVIKPEKGVSYKIWVKQDGEWINTRDAGADLKFTEDSRSYLEITEPRMYHIINNHEYGTRELHLYSTSDGFGIYAFTFGACE